MCTKTLFAAVLLSIVSTAESSEPGISGALRVADAVAERLLVQGDVTGVERMRPDWIRKAHGADTFEKSVDSILTAAGKPTRLQAICYEKVRKSSILRFYYLDSTNASTYFAITVNATDSGTHEFCRIDYGRWYEKMGCPVVRIDTLTR